MRFKAEMHRFVHATMIRLHLSRERIRAETRRDRLQTANSGRSGNGNSLAR